MSSPSAIGKVNKTGFLETPDDIRRTIRYIERNPLPLGLPVQRWIFVSEYDGWPLHKRAAGAAALNRKR